MTQICPTDGDVWIATSAGITRYKINADEWEHFTREDGLLEDQASSLAFKKDGTLIVGTQCHGIAVFNRSGGNYKHSKNITAPERFGANNCSPVPLIPEGEGLPTNQINQIIVASDNKIWIATPTGLVRSDSSLKTLYYIRGKDYADKVRGLYGGAPKDWKECPNEVKEYLLPEDYITCVAEDATGTIWLGTRRRGFMAIDPKTGRRGTGDRASMGMADNYVSAVLPMPDGKPLIGLYIGGVIKPKDELRLNKKDISKQGKKDKSVAKKDFPKLPSTIKPPTADELRALYYELKKMKPQKNPQKIIALNDDWRTQGDWIDRYGRYSACLCAQAGGGFNYFGGNYNSHTSIIGWIGRNVREKNDELRHWVHWLESNDKRVLQCLHLGGRKQADWDDHKEISPLSLDGPHVYGSVRVPRGKYILSLYFFNKDGHTRLNRMRDYVVTVKSYPIQREIFNNLTHGRGEQEPVFMKNTGGANLRVHDFWGGVYKRFFVQVENDDYITIRVDSNYSFNTIISGIFIDSADGYVSIAQHSAGISNEYTLHKWEESLEDISEDKWWGCRTLDYLLYRRYTHTQQYFSEYRMHNLTLLRHFVRISDGSPYSTVMRTESDKNATRLLVADLLRDILFFDVSEKVNYPDTNYESFAWCLKTLLGRDRIKDWKWDYDDFHKFIKEQKTNKPGNILSILCVQVDAVCNINLMTKETNQCIFQTIFPKNDVLYCVICCFYGTTIECSRC